MNKSTRIFAAIMGCLTGLGSVGHGIAEILQGDRPAADIGTRMGAFTLLPTYLMTGIAAAGVGAIIVLTAIFLLHRKFGPLAYLFLSIVSFLVGGGVAQTLGIVVAFLTATRINKPLSFWRKALGKKVERLSRLWLPGLLAGYGFLGAGICIWIFALPPGEIRDVGVMHYVCWAALSLGVILLLLAVPAGFARDIRRNPEPVRSA